MMEHVIIFLRGFFKIIGVITFFGTFVLWIVAFLDGIRWVRIMSYIIAVALIIATCYLIGLEQ